MNTKPNPQIQNLIAKLPLVLGATVSVSSVQASTDYGPAIWRPACSGHWYSGYTARQVFVIHDMEGYYASTIAYLQGCNNTVSVHYCVNGKKDATSDMPAGEITQMVRDADSSWTAGCWNRYAVQTEHEGFASNPAWYTAEMYQVSAALTRSKADKYGIAKDRNHIIAHGQKLVPGWSAWASANLSFNPNCNSHTDPGPYWDWTGFMNRILGAKNKLGDYDGDGKADAAVFRPSNGNWYLSRTSAGPFNTAFGYSSDIVVPSDYDGDGKTDLAVWRPSNATWYIQGWNNNYWTAAFGANGDVPIPGDYDGDGKADAAVFRPSNGYWYFSGSAGASWNKPSFGYSTDIPVPNDYDGDGKFDAAIWRPSNGNWYFSGSAGAYWEKLAYGYSTDIPVPGDYNGDGKADAAVWRPSNGTWYISPSGGSAFSVAYGQNGDIPVPTDYDGDGKLDAAVWRPSNATWYISKSTGGSFSVQYGQSGDRPLNLPSAIRNKYFP